jgi:hypothetical protein
MTPASPVVTLQSALTGGFSEPEEASDAASRLCDERLKGFGLRGKPEAVLKSSLYLGMECRSTGITKRHYNRGGR